MPRICLISFSYITYRKLTANSATKKSGRIFAAAAANILPDFFVMKAALQ
jgi:hypothetical protein